MTNLKRYTKLRVASYELRVARIDIKRYYIYIIPMMTSYSEPATDELSMPQ